MKRSFAIIICFVGLNAIIFWMTSVPEKIDTDTDPIEEMVETREKKTLLVPDASDTKSRSLLLGDVVETVRSRAPSAEPFQSAAAAVIPSLARLQILYREEGEWQEEWTTAVCVDPEGFFLAPWSRVTHGELFRLQFADGTFTSARLDSMDPATRIALFQCTGERSGYKPLPFGTGFSSSFGQPLMFLWLNENGHPRSQEGRLNGVEYHRANGFPDAFSGYLQSDILVSDRQSGGVLVDFDGKLLGLLVSDDVGLQRDFAPMLAAEEIRFVVRQLRQHGFVARSRIGLEVQSLDSSLKAVFSFSSDGAGILVSEVDPDSPAAAAGILPGDIITQISGRRIVSADFFCSMISRWPDGKEVPMRIVRGVETIEVAPLAEPSLRVDPTLAADADVSLPDLPAEADSDFWTLEDREINIHGDLATHAVVTSIKPESRLFSPPVREGDVLLQVNDVQNPDAEQVGTILHDLADDSALLLRCYRDGRIFWSAARPGSVR